MSEKKSLMERLLSAGYPREKMFHHCSDLYVYVTPLTARVIEAWCKEHGYSRTWHCPMFKDQVTGKPMYDCAFQYNVAYELWDRFTDVPVNPETECIEARFEKFPAGTHREEIWHWFEESFGVSVHDLMYS